MTGARALAARARLDVTGLDAERLDFDAEHAERLDVEPAPSAST